MCIISDIIQVSEGCVLSYPLSLLLKWTAKYFFSQIYYLFSVCQRIYIKWSTLSTKRKKSVYHAFSPSAPLIYFSVCVFYKFYRKYILLLEFWYDYIVLECNWWDIICSGNLVKLVIKIWQEKYELLLCTLLWNVK